MDARFFAKAPIFASATLIGFLFLVNMWNFAVERDWPKLKIRSAEPLNGLSSEKPIPWTLDAFLSGETQHAVSNHLGRASPLFPVSVRLKNQLLYSFFGVSGAPNLSIGRDGELISSEYIKEFCARGATPPQEKLDAWAGDIGEIGARAAALGKSFVYLISPSKPAYEPSWLPAGMSCPALAHPQAAEKLAPYTAALAARGVPFLDAQALLREERAHYPIDLFPRGGIHWNLLGAALAMREITSKWSAQPAGSPIGDFAFDWRERDIATGTDKDLVELLNLFWPPVRYPTASIERRGPAPTCPKTPRLLMVGSSFLRELIVVASQAPCPPTIDYWFHVQAEGRSELARYITKSGEIGNGERVPADPAELAQSLAEADAVVLEEIALNLSTTRQVGNLLAGARAAAK
jgi:alginate O-acetyltransferase complex protein AlgJ